MDKSEITVLVVEDEPLVLMSTADFLQDEGFTVLEAATADEAIVLLENNPQISILFTDVDMPGTMDGLKLAHFVRDRWPPIRIVVASGMQILAESQLPPGSRFFRKPYDDNSIISALSELLDAAS